MNIKFLPLLVRQIKIDDTSNKRKVRSRNELINISEEARLRSGLQRWSDHQVFIQTDYLNTRGIVRRAALLAPTSLNAPGSAKNVRDVENLECEESCIDQRRYLCSGA